MINSIQNVSNQIGRILAEERIDDVVHIKFSDYVYSQILVNVAESFDSSHDVVYFSELARIIANPSKKDLQYAISGVRGFYSDLFYLMVMFSGSGYVCPSFDNIFVDKFGLRCEKRSLREVKKASRSIGDRINPGPEYSSIVTKIRTKFDGSSKSALQMMYYLESEKNIPNLLEVID